MGDIKRDISRIRDYLRPSFRTVLISICFCLVLFVIVAVSTSGEHAARDAGIAASLSFLILGFYCCLEWKSYLSFLVRLKSGELSGAELVEDFDHAQSTFGGKILIGQRYVYGAQSGVVVPRSDVSGMNYGRIHYKGGWHWGIYSNYSTKLTDLRPEEWSEESIEQHLVEANHFLQSGEWCSRNG